MKNTSSVSNREIALDEKLQQEENLKTLLQGQAELFDFKNEELLCQQ